MNRKKNIQQIDEIRKQVANIINADIDIGGESKELYYKMFLKWQKIEHSIFHENHQKQRHIILSQLSLEERKTFCPKIIKEGTLPLVSKYELLLDECFTEPYPEIIADESVLTKFINILLLKGYSPKDSVHFSVYIRGTFLNPTTRWGITQFCIYVEHGVKHPFEQ